MAFSDYSTTPGSNTSINGINIAENCSPANINNAIRQLMADAKTFSAGVGDGSTFQPLDASLTAYAALTTAANKAVYYSAADTPVTYDQTAFGRTLGGLADAAALRTLLGSITASASSLANPGYITLSNGLTLQWGTGTIGQDSTGTITYPISFTTFAVCVVSGGVSSDSIEGDVHGYGAPGLSSQTIVNSGGGGTATYSWIAIGV